MLRRRSRLKAKTPLRRNTPLALVSSKRAAVNRQRRKVIAVVFGDRPRCAVPRCVSWADDVHEPLTRARGGSITDPANMVPLCRPHHDEITFTEPSWAYEIGLLVHSWDGGDAA